MIWRVVTSEATRQSYYEIVEHWTLDDLDDANCVIDAIELAHAQQHAAHEQARPRK